MEQGREPSGLRSRGPEPRAPLPAGPGRGTAGPGSKPGAGPRQSSPLPPQAQRHSPVAQGRKGPGAGPEAEAGLHPSWAARRHAKAQLQAKAGSGAGTKIRFDEEEGGGGPLPKPRHPTQAQVQGLGQGQSWGRGQGQGWAGAGGQQAQHGGAVSTRPGGILKGAAATRVPGEAPSPAKTRAPLGSGEAVRRGGRGAGEGLHPSWAARKQAQQMQMQLKSQQVAHTKIVFSDD